MNKPHPTANATISLPSALNDFFPTGGRNTTRVQFQFYGTHELFQVLYSSVTFCYLLHCLLIVVLVILSSSKIYSLLGVIFTTSTSERLLCF